VFVLTYATDTLGFTKGEALAAVMIASLVEVPLIPFAGWLSDRVDRRLVYAVAAVGAGIWVWVFLAMTRTGNLAALIIGVTVALAFHAFMYGPQAAYIAEQFHARLRYTGTSLAYTFAGIIGGAVAPAAFTWLLSKDESGDTVAAYVVVAMVVTLVGLAIGRRVVDDVDAAPAKVPADR
jgi:MFS family permease